MKLFFITVFLTCFILSAAGADTPGMVAFREGNYGAAARLLDREIKKIQPLTDDYFEHIFALVESNFYTAQINKAKNILSEVQSKVPAKFRTRFIWLEAQAAYLQYDHKKSEQLLDKILKIKNLPSDIICDAATLQCQIYLHSNRAPQALELIEKIIANPENLKKNEFFLRLMHLRILASLGKLNSIPAEFEKLKAKYPEQQGKLQHFELLIHAVNQDLKNYRELFNKIFPTERSMYAFVGDPVLYQGALLAEQQAQKEKNNTEIAFHLKNQTVFAPNDEYRALCWQNLIELYIRNKQLRKAMNEIKLMLQRIPEMPGRIQYELQYADLQSVLKDGDSGLKIYLKIRNDDAAPVDIRTAAAVKAADIYKKQNNRAEVFKLYAFLVNLPGYPEINNRGILLSGKYYFETGQFRMAESLLSKITSLSASYPEALFYLIQCKIANGEYDSASNDIQILSHIKNEDKNTHLPEFSLASVYFQAVIAEALKKDEEAAALYEKAARNISKRTGALPIITDSWLKAAELQFKRQSYSHAGLLFLTFAEHYPAHKSTPFALYKSVYSYFLAGRFDEMQYSIGKLRKSFAGHPLTISALFHEMDYFRQTDKLQEALKILDEINLINNKHADSNIAAQLLYDRAVILHQLQQDRNALQILDEMNNLKSPELQAEGMFLAGTIASELGENIRAAEYFKQAAEFRRELLFREVCNGRAADNYFIAGNREKNNELLKTAADIYSRQVKNTGLTKAFRLQSLYKWGRTLESLKDLQGALDAYNEALYLIEPDASNTVRAVPVWINKSALNAINIHLRQGGSNSLNDALFIIRRLKKLNTMPTEEIENLEYNVRNRYIQQD